MVTLRVLVLAVLVASCKPASPPEWRGIPTGSAADTTCAWHGEQATCISNGHAYLCVSHYGDSVIRCAPVSTTTPQPEDDK